MTSKNIPTISLQADPDFAPPKPERADASANRALILATARQLFAQQGVEAVCMAAIAEAAGVGKGTLYRRFANKGQLCLALMDEDMRHFQNDILAYLRQARGEAALTQLDHFLDRLVHFMDSHAPLMQEAQQQGALQGNVNETDSPQQWFQYTVRALLELAHTNGETPAFDVPYTVDAILAPLNANLFAYQRQALDFDPTRISQGLRNLIFNGLKHRTESPG